MLGNSGVSSNTLGRIFEYLKPHLILEGYVIRVLEQPLNFTVTAVRR